MADLILLILILLVGGLLLFISTIPSVPTHYTRIIKTGGLIEAKYLQFGPNHVTYQKEKGTELTKSLKNGDAVQVVKASDSDHEFTEGGE